jgi:hypothetical protein
MRSCLFAMVLLVGGNVVAAEEPTLPKTPPPEVVMVHNLDAAKGSLFIRRWIATTKLVYETEQVVINGAQVTRTVAKNVPLHSVATIELRLADLRVLDVRGTSLQKEEIAQRLKPGTIVLHTGEKSVDPRYVEVFGKDVLIIVGK